MLPRPSSCTYATNGTYKCRDTFADASLTMDVDGGDSNGQTGTNGTPGQTNTSSGTTQPGPGSMTVKLSANGKPVGSPIVVSLPHKATKGAANNICNVIRDRQGWGTMQISATCEPTPCNCSNPNNCPKCAPEKKLIWTKDWSANKVETGGFQGKNNGGVDPNGKLYVCRAPMNALGFDGVHVGKAFTNGNANSGKPFCNIPYGGKEYSIADGAEFLAYQS